MIVTTLTVERTFFFTLGVLAGVLFGGIIDCIETSISMRGFAKYRKDSE